MFSTRLPEVLHSNPLTRALRRLQASGVSFIDLTVSNPTRVGLCYSKGLFNLLNETGLDYEVHPLGLPTARAAIATHLRGGAVNVAPQQIVLTASTSEAYSLLFKILCNPGDEVLVPQPSYPLFEHLTRLDGVVSVPYRLEYSGLWSIDLDSVTSAISSRTRAILIVSPNNPTGSYATNTEFEELAELAKRYELALIGDEVFRPYPVATPFPPQPSIINSGAPLAFSLGGISKLLGLPQLKLAWIAVSGIDSVVNETLERLEIAYDTYLSVTTAVQRALGSLFESGYGVHEQIATRIRHNFEVLQRVAAEVPSCRVLPVGGGWSAVVRVPAVVSEEQRVLNLLEKHRVLVHPGYFFEFPEEAFIVCSLIPEPEVFAAGVARLINGLGRAPVTE